MNSYWLEYSKNLANNENVIKDNILENQAKLQNKEVNADVCIIGAGMSGLSTGYYLSKNGLKVVIIDKDEIGTKTSGHTTAKITLQHGLIYDYLINSFGEEFAEKYFISNKKAIDNIKKIIEKENIECDFEIQPNFVYTTKKDEVLKIQKEVDAINQIVRLNRKRKK